MPSIFNFNDADSIVQIELDESRNVLYTRSENSTIQVNDFKIFEIKLNH